MLTLIPQISIDKVQGAREWTYLGSAAASKNYIRNVSGDNSVHMTHLSYPACI